MAEWHPGTEPRQTTETTLLSRILIIAVIVAAIGMMIVVTATLMGA